MKKPKNLEQITWSELKLILLDYHVYCNNPVHKKASRLKKKLAHLSVQYYLEDRGFKEEGIGK